MRTVESKILSAIRNIEGKVAFSGSRTLSKRDHVAIGSRGINVYLWRTCIAEVTDDKILLNTGGWRSVTTKSRLNALLRLANANLRIYQKDFTWYVHDSALDETIEFHDGISFERFH